MTVTLSRPSLRAASRRWCPPMTVLSSARAITGSTSPNCRMLLVSDSSSSSESAWGWRGRGATGRWAPVRSEAMRTCPYWLGETPAFLLFLGETVVVRGLVKELGDDLGAVALDDPARFGQDRLPVETRCGAAHGDTSFAGDKRTRKSSLCC